MFVKGYKSCALYAQLLVKVMINIEKSEKEELKKNFLVRLGSYLKERREHKGYSQESVAQVIEVERSVLSKYEDGKASMKVDTLPVLSAIYDFELSECFKQPEYRDLVSKFKGAVTVMSHKYERKRYRQTLVKYERVRPATTVDGERVMIVEETKTGKVSFGEKIKSGSIVVEDRAYNDYEMESYLERIINANGSAVADALTMLDSISEAKKKETLKGVVADYVINELIVEPMVYNQDNGYFRRAYAYYKKYLELNGGQGNLNN